MIDRCGDTVSLSRGWIMQRVSTSERPRMLWEDAIDKNYKEILRGRDWWRKVRDRDDWMQKLKDDRPDPGYRATKERIIWKPCWYYWHFKWIGKYHFRRLWLRRVKSRLVLESSVEICKTMISDLDVRLQPGISFRW